MGLRGPFRIAGRFFARRHARHMGRRGRSVRPVGQPPGPGKSDRLRGGPVVRTFGEGGGVGKRASLMGGGRCNGARLGRAWAAAAWPPRLRAPKGAEARPVGAGRGAWAQARPSSAGRARLNNYSSLTCVRLMYRRPRPCPRPAPACIVLPRAAPRSAAARTPRTGYCGRRRRSDRPFRTGLQRWLGRKRRLSPKPPSFMSSLNPFFSTLKSLFGRRVRSWLRTNAGGAPNTCKSRG